MVNAEKAAPAGEADSVANPPLDDAGDFDPKINFEDDTADPKAGSFDSLEIPMFPLPVEPKLNELPLPKERPLPEPEPNVGILLSAFSEFEPDKDPKGEALDF